MKNLGLLVVLLVILCGYGAWNYQRSLAAESKQPRPYASYSDAQIDQLLAAYQGKVDELSKRYQAASGRRATTSKVQMLGDGVEQFNRVQRASRAVRDLGEQLSEEQTSLKAIQQEKAQRAHAGGALMSFLRRAFVPAT